MKKLTNKERFDIATMVYFIPSSSKKRIYPNDKIKMAILSSTGVKPERETPGFRLLKWGKTYRDEQITSYKRDIRAGLFTKAELLEEIPPRFRDWLWSKIKDVPYDEDAYTLVNDRFVLTGKGSQPMLISEYRKYVESL